MNRPYDKLLPKKYKDGKCGECSHELEFDEGQEPDYNHPGMRETWFCPECGWEPDECPNYDKFPLTNSEITELRKLIDIYGLNSPTFTVDEMFKQLPSEDFEYEQEEVFDWDVYSCGEKDCPIQWHRVAYLNTVGRKNSKRFVTIHTTEMYDDKEFSYGWDDGEDETEITYALNSQLENHFKGWAKYWLYCAQWGVDPLDECLKSFSTSDDFYDFCIKSVKEFLDVEDEN